jgi:formate hydrogenlyase subunit 6/NADH:ubiquinone oxidoreductase subunit I
MAINLYERLRALLDIHPFGCPPAPEIIEILKILFTEEEAMVALGLSFRPLTVQEIADRGGVNFQEAKKGLESLADKGLVFARQKDGVWGYALFDIVHLFENPFRKGIHNETVNKLIPYWKKYLPTLGMRADSTTTILRIIPIQEKIEYSPGVLPYEKIYEMINRAKVAGIAHCACRELEQKCDAPREGCMIFDDTCNFLVERGFARYLTKEEMKQKVREFNKAGLVLQVNNTRDRLDVICSCCPCCCQFLRAVKEFGNPRALTRSAFIPVWDLEHCSGCGKCAEERCPMKAIEMVDKKPVMKIERCIGCGLCVTGCPNDARHLERSVEVPEPPANAKELGSRILQARGKLGAFLEVMAPKAKSPLDE